MSYTVKRRFGGLRITIDNAQSLQHPLLKFFVTQKIKYDKTQFKELIKVNKVNIESSGNEIQLTLKTRKWELFDVQEIKKCLDYALTNITSD